MHTSPQGPTFAITDPWLREELALRGFVAPHAARYDFGGFVEFVCPWTGELLTTETTPRGIRRALNRLHSEAVANPTPAPTERPAEVDAPRPSRPRVGRPVHGLPRPRPTRTAW